MAECFNEARDAAVAIYCRQVLNMSMEEMGEHERRRIRIDLGIDVDAMPHQEYRNELLRDRIKKYYDFTKQLVEKVDKMKKDAGLEMVTIEQAVNQ